MRLYEEKEWTGDRLDYPKGGPVKGLYSKAEIEHIRALYAAEVTLVDKWVGRLLEKIEDLGLLDNTMVVFTTDHGCLHGDHGIMHKHALYEEVARIPLMVYHPQVKGSQRNRALVQIPDVPATLLDVAAAERAGLDWMSLLPLMQGKTKSHRRIAFCSEKLSEWFDGNFLSVTDGTWSLVYSINDKNGELFHLPSEPKQEENLIRQEPARARRMLKQLIQLSRERGAAEKSLQWLDGRRSLLG